jgi:hypothetical protein
MGRADRDGIWLTTSYASAHRRKFCRSGFYQDLRTIMMTIEACDAVLAPAQTRIRRISCGGLPLQIEILTCRNEKMYI